MTATAIYTLGGRESRAIFFFRFCEKTNTYEAKVDENEYDAEDISPILMMMQKAKKQSSFDASNEYIPFVI